MLLGLGLLIVTESGREYWLPPTRLEDEKTPPNLIFHRPSINPRTFYITAPINHFNNRWEEKHIPVSKPGTDTFLLTFFYEIRGMGPIYPLSIAPSGPSRLKAIQFRAASNPLLRVAIIIALHANFILGELCNLLIPPPRDACPESRHSQHQELYPSHPFPSYRPSRPSPRMDASCRQPLLHGKTNTAETIEVYSAA